MTDIFEIIRSIRNLRAEFRIQPNQLLDVSFSMPNFQDSILNQIQTIKYLARLNEVSFNSEKSSITNAITIVTNNGTMIIPLAEFADIDNEISRLNVELNDCSKNIDKVNARLLDNQFISKAPDEIIERERIRLAEINARRDKIEEILSNLNG